MTQELSALDKNLLVNLLADKHESLNGDNWNNELSRIKQICKKLDLDLAGILEARLMQRNWDNQLATGADNDLS